MRHRSLAPMSCLLAWLALASSAQAHRLDADYQVMPGNRVCVESWFGKNVPPKMATVQVRREGGDVIAQGKMSSQGFFVFGYGEQQPLTIEVEAEDGHAAKLVIPADKLVLGETGTTVREEPLPVAGVVAGVGLLLAAAALILALRNSRRLARLEGERDNNSV